MGKEMVLTPEELAENELLNNAIAFAVEKHKNGLRKGTKMPYIVHPLEVLHYLMLMGADKNLMAAGVLHDTVEDTDATLEEIAEKFGEDVASLVASHTEKDKSLPWKKRKDIALEHLKHANKREQMLVLADKLSNMRAIARDYDKIQDKLWERFNRGKEDQAWYYNAGADALVALADYEDTYELYDEFAGLVDYVFNDTTDEENEKLLQEAKELKDKGDIGAYLVKIRQTVDNGSIIGMLILGEHIHNGDFGLEVNNEEAFNLWMPPAEARVPEAMHHVGIAYFMGEGVEPDIEEAVCYLLPVEDKKYPDALYILGTCYLEGHVVEPDKEKGIQLLTESAEQGYGPAIQTLADSYLNANGVEKDEKKAFELIKKAVENGYEPIYHIYGMYKLYGIGCEVDEKEGFGWVKKGADALNEYAMCILGRFYLEGDFGVKQNFKKAKKLLEKSLELDNTEAAKYLALMYVDGSGVKQDYEKAAEYYTIAANNDDDEARYALATLYFEGLGVKKNKKRALSLMKKAAKNEYVPAMVFLAEAYDGVKGVPEDLKESFDWYNKAAKLGSPVAQYNLGKYYENGKGTRKNTRKAFEWYMQAAEQGEVMAMNDIGIYYANGTYIDQNEAKAFEWFSKAAADEDYAPALYNLGSCYENGFGVEADEKEAERLRKLADKLAENEDEELVEVESTKK